MMENKARRARRSFASETSKVTMGMVAKVSGVSRSTVSRILNGTATVKENKQNAVRKAIAELGFVPNPIARGLAGGRTYSLGVITQALDSPFYGESLRGVEEACFLADYSPLFVSGHSDSSIEMRCVDILRSRRVDGLIILTGSLEDKDLLELSTQLPVVVTGRSLTGENLFSMDFQNFEGARLATQHLLSLGHRRIAFITGESYADSNDRLRGYRTALESAGIDFNPALVLPGRYTQQSGLQAAEHLIDSGEPVTAIFAANDEMAFGAALALHRRGIRVPDDISLVGFDNLASSAYWLPPLTTIDQAAHEIGRLAATAMLQLLAGETPTCSLPEPRLVIRGSTRALQGG